jgi:hypothetical protein
MTEKELIIAAKIFRANCGANGDEISYTDSLKIVLLSKIVEGRDRDPLSQGEMELVARLITTKNPWYKFW